jgi:Gamma-glutamyltranspeptidase
MDDLKQYRVKEAASLSTFYLGMEILGASPPYSGAVMQMALNIMERYNFPVHGFTPENAHLMIESWKWAYSDRNGLGDPAFVPGIPELVDQMLSKEHAAELRQRIVGNTTCPPSYYVDLVNVGGCVCVFVCLCFYVVCVCGFFMYVCVCVCVYVCRERERERERARARAFGSYRSTCSPMKFVLHYIAYVDYRTT